MDIGPHAEFLVSDEFSARGSCTDVCSAGGEIVFEVGKYETEVVDVRFDVRNTESTTSVRTAREEAPAMDLGKLKFEPCDMERRNCTCHDGKGSPKATFVLFFGLGEDAHSPPVEVQGVLPAGERIDVMLWNQEWTASTELMLFRFDNTSSGERRDPHHHDHGVWSPVLEDCNETTVHTGIYEANGTWILPICYLPGENETQSWFALVQYPDRDCNDDGDDASDELEARDARDTPSTRQKRTAKRARSADEEPTSIVVPSVAAVGAVVVLGALALAGKVYVRSKKEEEDPAQAEESAVAVVSI